MKTLVRKKSGLYEARMRVHTHERIVYRSMGTRDKDIAQKRMDSMYRQLEREAHGVACTTLKEKAAAEKPLINHLRSFLSEQETLGLNDRYLNQLKNKLFRIFNECNWFYIKDIEKRSFNEWRSRNASLSPSTLNQYLCALTGFTDWLLENEYLDRNPLANIKRVSSKKWKEDSPRALSKEEVEALLDAAGPRRTIYLTAVLTGIRRGELKQLKIRHIDLGCDVPHIVVPSDVAKNDKERRQPLHNDLIEVLRELKQGKQPSDKAFEIPTWKTFQRDLKRAGIAHRNEEGRKVSFHSLRHTFCTSAHISGIPARTIQELMGHSDLKLTVKTYTDTALLPVADAVQKIPSYGGAPQIAPLKSGSASHLLAQGDTDALAVEFAKVLDSKEFCHALAQIGAEGKWWAIQNSNL